MLHASTYVTFKWHRSEPVLNSMLRGLLLLKSRRPQWRGLPPDLSLGRGDTIHLAVKPRRGASTKAPLSVSLDIAADQKKTLGQKRKEVEESLLLLPPLAALPPPSQKRGPLGSGPSLEKDLWSSRILFPFLLAPRVLLPSSPWEAVVVQFSSGARRK